MKISRIVTALALTAFLSPAAMARGSGAPRLKVASIKARAGGKVRHKKMARHSKRKKADSEGKISQKAAKTRGKTAKRNRKPEVDPEA